MIHEIISAAFSSVTGPVAQGPILLGAGSDLIPAILCLGGMGTLFGLCLAFASKKFKVEIDPRTAEIGSALPGANCGACGYPGCQGYALAVASGEADCNLCAPGGPATVAKIASIMGVFVASGPRKVAVIRCDAGTTDCGDKFRYQGVASCRAAILVLGGPKTCVYGCMGFGTCSAVCLFSAVDFTPEGKYRINREKCTACGKCVEACPKKIIELVEETRIVQVLCSSKDKGKEVREKCKVGCIACKLCEKACSVAAIHVTDNIAVIDPRKCVACGLCARKCPRKIIEDLGGGEVHR